jgi:O-antigen/teichoic acid export membrane protein
MAANQVINDDLAATITPPSALYVIGRESTFGFLGAFGTLALAFVTKMLLARALSPGDFGLLLTGQTIVALALPLAQLCLPDAVVRFVGLYAAAPALTRSKGVLLSSLKLGGLATVLVTIGLGLSASLIANGIYRQAELTSVLVILAVAMPFNTVADMLAAAYRGLGQLWVKVAFVDLGRALWVVLVVGLVLALNANSLMAVALVYLTASVGSTALTCGLFLRSRSWRVQPGQAPLGDLLRYSMPLVGVSLLTWPMSSIPLLLGSTVSLQAVAYYNLAMALGNFINMPVSAIELAALPVWAGWISQGLVPNLRRVYAFAARWCLVAGSIVFVPLFLCPGDVLTILYGPNYKGAAPVMQTIAALILLNAATGPNDSLLRAFGDTRQILLARLVDGSSLLAVGFLLVPLWGMPGALVALAVSDVLSICVYVGCLLVRRNIHPLDAPYLKTLLAGTLALVASGMAQGYLVEGMGRIAATVLLYSVVLFGLLTALRVFTPQDRRVLKSAYRLIRNTLAKV